jgi:FMN phosphatase YigB (HAD superfamily)
MEQFDWQNSVWFFDVDDTVLNTDGAHEFGAQLAREYLATAIGSESAEKIIDRFNEKYWFIRRGYSARDPSDWAEIHGGQAAYEALLELIRSYQPEVIQKFGAAKLWSREVLLKLCADELGIALRGEAAEAAAAAFWDGVAEKTAVIPGAAELIAALRHHGRSVHLFTSSDGRLNFHSERQTFTYDPERSRSLKTQRVERRRGQGLDYDTLTTGDPLDKPALSGFQSMLAAAAAFLGRPPAPENCVMVGDSHEGDLAVPHDRLNFGLCVWYRQNSHEVKWLDESLLSVPDLARVAGFFSNETV